MAIEIIKDSCGDDVEVYRSRNGSGSIYLNVTDSCNDSEATACFTPKQAKKLRKALKRAEAA